MKYLFKFLTLVLLFVNYSFACNEPGTTRFINPDGTIGGKVGPKVRINSNVYIGKDSAVCESAWIDSNVIISGNSFIAGQAWIKEFSEISGNSKIYEHAIVEGSKYSHTKISGRPMIHGNAKISAGSEIKDDAEIFGEVVIVDSIIGGLAKVCNSANVINKDVFDSRYCSGTGLNSDIEFELANFQMDKFNPFSDLIKIRVLNSKISSSESDLNIFVNAKKYTSYTINPNSIIVSDFELNEGKNVLQITGLDENGNKFYKSFEFYCGSGTQEIEVNSVLLSSKFNIKVSHNIDQKKITGSSILRNNKIVLRYLPLNVHFGTKIYGTDGEDFILETFDNHNDSLNISAYRLPSFINNINDFEDDFASWKVSDVSKVSIASEDGQKIVEILPDPIQKIEFSKLFRLSKGEAGLSLKFQLPQLPFVLSQNSNFKVEIAFISLKDKKVNVFEYSELTDSKSKILSNPNEIGDGEFVVFFRLHPVGDFDKSISALRFQNALRSDVQLRFFPYSLNILNKSDFSMDATEDPDCKNPNFEVLNNPSFNIVDLKQSKRLDDLNFFHLSVGDIWDMKFNIFDNRIHAYFDILPTTIKFVEMPTILIVQNDEIKKELELSKCAKEFYNSSAFSNIYPFNTNIVKHLFSLKFSDSLGIDTSYGSKVSIYLKAKVTDGKKTFVKLSDPVEVPILVASHVPRSKWFGNVDSYDSEGVGLLKTGGDKWILPYYENVLFNMISNADQWQINDLSKINGGSFPGHDSHSGGTDGDFSVFGFNLSSKNEDPSSWKAILDKIESFLENNENLFPLIQTIYLSRAQLSSYRPSFSQCYEQKFVDSRFQYRCIGNNPDLKRFIWFDKNTNHRSLLKHWNDHYDHLHVRYEPLKENGTPQYNDPQPPSNWDLDDFWFSFEQVDGEQVLNVELKDEGNFPSNLKFFWRFQNKKEFDDIATSIQYGPTFEESVTCGVVQPTPKESKFVDPNKHIYVMIADLQNGGCVERYVELNLDGVKKLKKWSYKLGDKRL